MSNWFWVTCKLLSFGIVSFFGVGNLLGSFTYGWVCQFDWVSPIAVNNFTIFSLGVSMLCLPQSVLNFSVVISTDFCCNAHLFNLQVLEFHYIHDSQWAGWIFQLWRLHSTDRRAGFEPHWLFVSWTLCQSVLSFCLQWKCLGWKSSTRHLGW